MEEEDDDDDEDPSTPRPPAAHTTVLYDPSLEGEHARVLEEDEDALCLPPHLLEPLSLPGTPAGGDGSSYSSTNSSHGLLLQTTPPKPDGSLSDDKARVA